MSVRRWIFSGRLAGVLAVALVATAVRADEASDQYAVAAGHYQAQRWQLAAEEFETFLNRYPDHADRNQSVFFLAEALLQLGKYSQARQRFQQYLALELEGRFSKPALFREGEAAYLSDDYETAKASLGKFHQRYADDPLNAFVLTYLGGIALAEQNWAGAEQHYRQCLETFPDGKMQDDCRFGLARVLEKQAKYEEAERLYLALTAKTGNRLADDAQFRLGAVQYAAGQYEDAVKTFEPFDSRLITSRHRATALLGSGWAMVKLNRLDDARKYFERIISDPKLGTEARYWLGWILKTQNQWAAAAKLLLETAEAAPAHRLVAAIRFHAGDAMLRDGNTDAALEQFRWIAAHAEDGNEWGDDALRGEAQAALLAKDHSGVDRIASEFERRYADSPLSGDVARFRAQSLIERQDHQPAAAILEPIVKAAEGEADHPEVRYLLALAYEGLKRYDEAETVLTPVLASADPRLKADAQLALASIFLARQRFAEAISPLESLRKEKPEGDAAVKSLGQLAICYARTGELDTAKKLYVQLIRDYPDHDLLIPSTEQLAEAAYDAGEREWADKLFAWLAADGQQPEYRVKGLSGQAWSQYKSGKMEEAAVTFGRLLDASPPSKLAAEGALVRGQILQQLGRLDAALEMFDLVIKKYSQTDRYPEALWAAARIRDDRGEDREAAGLYERLANKFPDFPEADAVLYRWGWTLADLGEQDRFYALLERLTKNYPQSTFRADAVFRLAQHAYETSQLADARRWVDSLLSGEPAEAVRESGIRENALYLRAQIDVAEARWPEAQRGFEEMLAQYPEGPLRQRAEYGVAEAAFRQGRYEEARERLGRLAQQTEGKQEPWLAVVQLRLAQTLCHEKKWNEAYDVASKIESQYPGFEEQFEADYVTGRCLANRADFDGAREAYGKVIRSARGEKTETAAKAQLMIAESYFHQENYEAALREFLRLEILYAYPELQSAALMQAAKCHELLGEVPQATELYQRLVKSYPETEFAAAAANRLDAPHSPAAKPGP